jgi:hypothetical protein
VTTGAHTTIPSELDSDVDYSVDRRGELPWAVGFYAAIALALLLIAFRLFWPPEEHHRLTTEAATATHVQ